MNEEALDALATALYDDENTARLSEHPEDVPAYRAKAENVRRWLRVQGYDVVALPSAGLAAELAGLIEQRKIEPAALMRQDHPRALEVAVARANGIDRAIGEKVEANLPAIIAALSSDRFNAGVEAGKEAAAKFLEANARHARNTHDLISVQSEFPMPEPVFSCGSLDVIATAIRALKEVDHDRS